MTAFVLSSLPSAPLSSPFGSAIYKQTSSSVADEMVNRRYYGHCPSPAASTLIVSPHHAAVLYKKENSPQSPPGSAGSTTSLVSPRLLDVRLNAPSSPRRSWSWAVPGEHLECSSYDLISKFQANMEDAEVESNHKSMKDASSSTYDTALSSITSSPTDDPTKVSRKHEPDDDFDFESEPETPERESFDIYGNHNAAQRQNSPFKKWLKGLKKRPREPSDYWQRPQWGLEDLLPQGVYLEPPSHKHRQTPSSNASTALLAAVRTASITMTSLSLYPVSRQSARTSYHRRGGSQQDAGRTSFDSVAASVVQLTDDGTCTRSLQRHRIVEEMVSSEESYIRDLKTLSNVYLAVLPKNLSDRRTVQRSVTGILALHEQLLAQLQYVLWDDNVHITEKNSEVERTKSRHVRWHSLDNSPVKTTIRLRRERFNRHSIDTSQPSLIHPRPFMADTQLVIDVSKIFDRFMSRFLVYEAFAAHHDLLGEASASTKEVPRWAETEKGIEILTALTLPVEHREIDRNKALAFSDLPIQRICKYPLFFRDLCKFTPACDDPVAHSDLQKVLMRLEETADQINYALRNKEVRKRVEISWLLQSRTEFEDRIQSHPFFTKLGHVILCGVLHIAYPVASGVKGHYHICTLYRSALVIASAKKASNVYVPIICIPLLNANLETANNGKGLQCHTAQFTWKVTFDLDRRQHEILLSACCETEEEAWKRNLRARIAFEVLDQAEGRPLLDIPSYVHPDIRPTGPSFGPFLNFSRRLSIQRAATVGAKSGIQQVIIKNTEAPRYTNHSANSSNVTLASTSGQSAASSYSVMRSQSHMSAVHISTLAPRRSERVKLENHISDVYTKAALPFPGMSGKIRGENSIRASANSVMRKLSMASIASNFSKRSVSHATISVTNAVSGLTGRVAAGMGGRERERERDAREEEGAEYALSSSVSGHTLKFGRKHKHQQGDKARPLIGKRLVTSASAAPSMPPPPTPPGRPSSALPPSARTASPAPTSQSSPRPVLVNFHSAPEAFLPTDFEVGTLRPSCPSRVPKLSERLSMTMGLGALPTESTQTTLTTSITAVKLPILSATAPTTSIRTVSAHPNDEGGSGMALTPTASYFGVNHHHQRENAIAEDSSGNIGGSFILDVPATRPTSASTPPASTPGTPAVRRMRSAMLSAFIQRDEEKTSPVNGASPTAGPGSVVPSETAATMAATNGVGNGGYAKDSLKRIVRQRKLFFGLFG